VRSKGEALEGFGPLEPLGSRYTYRDGVAALADEHGEAGITHIRIERCGGQTTRVAIPAEPLNLEPHLWNPELGGGLLTWDTGHVSAAYDQEELEPTARGDLRHATLTSYGLNTGAVHRWRLPALVLRLLGREKSEWTRGVFGYSAHTRFAVFWIAARELDCANEKGLCGPTEASDIYSARI
jgi:hypothetical protein